MSLLLGLLLWGVWLLAAPWRRRSVLPPIGLRILHDQCYPQSLGPQDHQMGSVPASGLDTSVISPEPHPFVGCEGGPASSAVTSFLQSLLFGVSKTWGGSNRDDE